MSNYLLNQTFGYLHKDATGATREDYLYDQAEAVRAVMDDMYAYVTYKGVEYGPAEVTRGALDGDKEKSTVLVQTNEGKWVKLWFFNKELYK
jgi:hypothetical protein